MATGLVSSAQAQTASASRSIVSGEKVSTSLEALKDPKAKRYFHQVPGARFIMPNGLEVVFLGGQFTTSDEAIMAELDQVVNKSSSLIYTKSEAAERIRAEQAKAAQDAADGGVTEASLR